MVRFQNINQFDVKEVWVVRVVVNSFYSTKSNQTKLNRQINIHITAFKYSQQICDLLSHINYHYHIICLFISIHICQLSYITFFSIYKFCLISANSNFGLITKNLLKCQLIARIYMQITQKTEKHFKLTLVYNEITNIKAQLLNLIKPNHPPNTNMGVNTSILPQNAIEYPNQFCKLQANQSIKKEDNNDVIIKGAICPAHYTSLKFLKSNLNRAQKQKDPMITDINKKNSIKGVDSLSKMALKFQVKSPRQIKTQQTELRSKKLKRWNSKTQAEVTKQRQPMGKYMVQTKNIKIAHSRHKSQVEQNKFKELNKSKSNQKLLYNEKYKRQPLCKYHGILKKVSNTIKEEKQEKEEKKEKEQKQQDQMNTKTKRLLRMPSHLTNIPTQNSENRHLSIDNFKKIIDLEQEIKKKNKIIQTLSDEIQQIEKNFSQMQASLRQLLSSRMEGLKQIKQGQVNKVLSEIINQLQEKRLEIKSLTLQNYFLNQLNKNQQNKLKEFQGHLQSKLQQNNNLIHFQQQKDCLKRKLQLMASKLQISVNENKLKDEFIINFLFNRNKEKEKQGWPLQTLQIYLQKINYPNNCLLDKLCEQQKKTCQLQKIIQKLLKKQIQQ